MAHLVPRRGTGKPTPLSIGLACGIVGFFFIMAMIWRFGTMITGRSSTDDAADDFGARAATRYDRTAQMSNTRGIHMNTREAPTNLTEGQVSRRENMAITEHTHSNAREQHENIPGGYTRTENDGSVHMPPPAYTRANPNAHLSQKDMEAVLRVSEFHTGVLKI
ncbi:hypothetical protein DM02DRAFT_136673 [Periconia macrospinosa]|uniref:Uncharacterized protein n=1 Tax=Periconia macrospinosa TaxID=97972 RepID=A0A2V1DD68_9PLEO|nr:hypothetical protein DM02DRAFT_136673 [Periconia macrospinosa]